MASVKYWIWLSQLGKLKTKTKNLLIEHFSDPLSIYYANESEYSFIPNITKQELEALRDKNLEPAERILADCDAKGISIMTIGDAQYPARLKNTYDPPVVLYVKGKLPWMDEEAAIAIVGTRRASPYGIKTGIRFGYELTKCGGLVVSGLAAGIDTAGAEGALRAGGGCVGVLGCAIDSVYPVGNARLYKDVASVGALISEYPPGAETKASNFPQRNRIMSGISAGVLIIEAPKKSGALITAARASEQGRDVFVVPGNIDTPNFVGSNSLIKDGAKAVMNGEDILVEYESIYPAKIRKLFGGAVIPQEEIPAGPVRERQAPKPAASGKKPEQKPVGQSEEKPAKNSADRPETGRGFLKFREPNPNRLAKKNKAGVPSQALREQLTKLSGEQLAIVTAIGNESRHIDELIETTGLPAPKMLSELTQLQIRGIVEQQAGKRFSIKK